jgi:hypothetical protein
MRLSDSVSTDPRYPETGDLYPLTPSDGQLRPLSDHLTQQTLQMLSQAGLLYATVKRGPLETLFQVAQHPDFGHSGTVRMVAWAIKGQLSGHEWHACERCGGLRLITPSPAHPRLCLMTPMCAGRMQRIARRPRLSKALRYVIASDPMAWDDIAPWM